jgi:type IV pilus assembly protein PilM
MRFQLTSKTKNGPVVGLDIEAGSIAATEVRVNGAIEVVGSAIGPLEPGAFQEGEVLDADILADALKSLFSKNKLAKQVRLGIGNQRLVVRTLRLPAIEDPKEMDAAIQFQAQEQMPMPLDQAVLEHQVVGGVPAEEGAAPQVDVVVVAARRDMISSFVQPLRRAGLEPVGIDLSVFAMIRALSGVSAAPEGEQPQAQGQFETVLYCNVGDVTNLAVAHGRACLFARISPVGLAAISSRFGTSHGLSPEHADQWLAHVGLEQPLEQIEGDPQIVADARRYLEEGVTGLIDELRLSLDYYGSQEGTLPAQRIVVCGPGVAIPGLIARMEAGLQYPISVGRPSPLEAFDPSVAARLTLPLGLALEQ